LRKTSSCPNGIPARFSITASRSASRLWSSPVLTRCGAPYDGLCGQRLHLHQERARPLHRGHHGGAGGALRPLAEEELGRVADGDEPLGRHPEDADLVHPAEPVLGGAQDAVVQPARALEVEHRVHDVLQRLGPRDPAPLGDVAHEEDGGSGLLGEALEAGGALAHLPHVPRRPFQLGGVDRLDRVDQEDVRRALGGAQEDAVQLGFGQEGDRAGGAFQAVGAELHLVGALLAGNVERAPPGPLQPAGDLEEDGGLPDPRLAADQDDGAGNDPAAENEVELGDPRGPALALGSLHVAEAHGGHAGGGARDRSGPGRGPRALGRGGLFHKRVPLLARGALPLPLARLVAAVAAEERGSRLRHVPRSLRCVCRR
jgi:hypothetical protein